MADIARTTLQREICRRELDALWRLVKDTKTNPLPDSIDEGKLRMTRLPKVVSKYESCILSMVTHPDNAARKEDLLVEFDIFNDDVTRIELICSKPPFIHQDTLNQSAIHNTAFNTTQTSFNASSYARLPKLNLPPFNGDIENWQSIFDIYSSSIHDNETLSPVQKFQYLRTCLRDQALSVIQNFKLTDANYEIALTALKERYQRNRLISTLHVQRIVNVPALKDTLYNSVNAFVSTVKEHLTALRALKEPVDQWGKILAVILISKLEMTIRNRFESQLDNNQLLELETLLTFLEQFISAQQWQTLEPRGPTCSKTNSNISMRFGQKLPERKNACLTTSIQHLTCLECKGSHPMHNCIKLRNLTTRQRFELIRDNHNCYNCLAPNQQTADCKSKMRCRTCHKRHHTLLHFGEIDHTDGAHTNQTTKWTSDHKQSGSQPHPSDPHPPRVLITTNVKSTNHTTASRVLLSTALVLVQDSQQRWKEVRVLLDSGSEASLITENCRRNLNLNWRKTNQKISGVSNVEINAIKGLVTCSFRPRNRRGEYSVTALVVKNIAAFLPSQGFDRFESSMLNGLHLADPTYNEPGPIDLLLGADIYVSLVRGNTVKLPEGPFAVETALGVVILGPLTGPANHLNSFHISVDEELGATLRRFWELEEVSHKPVQSEDEIMADLKFTEQHYRTPKGRYVVPLLFKTEFVELGGSFGPALACYRSLRTRLNNNPTLREEYLNFMRDYLESNHMSKLPFKPLSKEDGYFIPHHCVIKHDGPTMKIRVVFNASKPSSNGVSLNDTLLAGPPLQIDLGQVIMRQRLYPIILTADIRQVLIPNTQRRYQKILWDFDLSLNPQVYQLNTVTYGTTCAPFLVHKDASPAGSR